LPIYFKEIDDQEFEKDKRKIDYEYDKKAANEKNKATTPNDTTITSLLDWLHANKLKTDAIK
jgi:prolyl-tRNA synthetase